GVFDDPHSTYTDPAERNQLSGQVEILRPYNIHSVLTDKQPKRGAQPRIDIEQFVGTVALIEAESDIENSFVASSSHESVCLLIDDRIWKAHSKCGHACIHRRLVNLFAGDAKEAVRVLIKITIEHPDG